MLLTTHCVTLMILVFFTLFWILMKNQISMELPMNLDPMFNSITMKISLSFQFMAFTIMISMVGSIVAYYSESYLNTYNTWKFTINLILFMASMFMIICSDTFFFLMIGWDMLGLTSVFLITFYSNKISTTNAILTMIYNRAGDCLMVLGMALILSQNNEFFYFYPMMWLLTKLMFICASTKSAQFPLGAWLPAAMSAPTPISAMVHSSTLVTAGIFLYLKYDFILISNEVFMLSLLTMIMGSALANSDLDFKKIVAFSTMSQISMIIYFIFKFSLLIGILHMIFHALFKSFLFVQSGLNFSKAFGSQYKMKLISKMKSTLNSIMAYFSIFSMAGLTFSSSFFTKDLILEYSHCSSSTWMTLLFLISSILSVSYCVKLMNINKKNFDKDSGNEIMKSNKSYFTLFSVICLASGKLSSMFFILDVEPLLNKLDCMILMMIICIPIFKPFVKSKVTNLYKSMFMSTTFFNMMMLMFIKGSNYWGISDSLFKFKNLISVSHPAMSLKKSSGSWAMIIFLSLMFW